MDSFGAIIRGMSNIIAVEMVMMTVVSTQAQQFDYEKKHEIGITYGWISNSDWINVFEDVGAAMVGTTFEGDSYVGPVSLEYFYRFNPTVAVGGIVAYGMLKQDVYLLGKKNGKDGVSTNRYLTVMPSVKFDWLRRKNFGMYSKLAAGVTLRNEKIKYNSRNSNHDDSELHFNWQASLVGVEAGSENVRGFAEVGIGEQGTIVVGIRTRL